MLWYGLAVDADMAASRPPLLVLVSSAPPMFQIALNGEGINACATSRYFKALICRH
jgi:hypothetical protein